MLIDYCYFQGYINKNRKREVEFNFSLPFVQENNAVYALFKVLNKVLIMVAFFTFFFGGYHFFFVVDG